MFVFGLISALIRGLICADSEQSKNFSLGSRSLAFLYVSYRSFLFCLPASSIPFLSLS